jgi:hypothetical protein
MTRVHSRFAGFVPFLRKHGILLSILAVLSVVAASGSLLRGQLIPPFLSGGSSGTATFPSLRACGPEGTIFEPFERIDDVVQAFQGEASAVTAEREMFLKTPSAWTCPLLGEDAEPPMPKLQSLASRLPGWYYPYPAQGFGELSISAVEKPVPFESYGSVLGELLREYECKLSEMQGNAEALVLRNADSSAQYFCCSAGTCQEASASCQGAQTTDPLCGHECPAGGDITDLLTRSDPFYRRLTVERNRGRYAVERTVEGLRSFEMEYPVTRDLLCFARASLDLRSEMSLLADALSCMPKIWNAGTSLHDRGQ